jgi:hypothetical protein
MIVGEKYYVSKKDYTKFCIEAENVSISLSFIKGFDKEKSKTLIGLEDNYMRFDFNSGWYFSEGFKYFKLKINIKQEEMDV